MPLPALGAIVGAIGRMAAAGGAELGAGALARGAGGTAVHASKGAVLENTLLTNAKQITAQLFSATGDTAAAARATTKVSGKLLRGDAAAQAMESFLYGSGGGGGSAGGTAAKFLRGDWSAPNAMRDAMLHGVQSMGGGPSDGMGDRMAAGAWDAKAEAKREADEARKERFRSLAAGAGAAGYAVTSGNLFGGLPNLNPLQGTKSGEHFSKAFDRVTSPTKWADPLFAAKVGMDVAQAWANLPFDMERFSISLLEGSRHLSRFNGAIAKDFMLLERQNILLSAQSAQATSGSHSVLTRQTMELRENLQPIKDAGTNIQQMYQAGLDKMLNLAAEWLPAAIAVRKTAEAVNEFINKQAGGGIPVLPPAAQFADAAINAYKKPNPPVGGQRRPQKQ